MPNPTDTCAYYDCDRPVGAGRSGLCNECEAEGMAECDSYADDIRDEHDQ